MNNNTIAGFNSGTGRNKFSAQTIAVAGPTALVVGTDTGTTTAFLQIPQASSVVGSSNPLSVNANPAILSGALGAALQGSGTNRPYFSTDSFNGHAFRVRITGDGTNVTAAQTVQVGIYCQTGTTPLSANLVATTAASPAIGAAGTFSFVLEAILMWDAVSGIVTGSSLGGIGTGTAQAGVTAVTTAPAAVTLPNLQFLAGVTLGAATSVTLTVREFAIDLA